MTSTYLLTALLAISPLIPCQARGAANLTSNASRSAYPTKTGYGAPRQPVFTFEELFHLQNRFWKNFISPANEKQVHPLLCADNQIGSFRPVDTGESHQLQPPCRRHPWPDRHHTEFSGP